MQLDFAMLALNVDQASNGKLHIFGGGFDTMAMTEVPANVPPFNVVSKFNAEHSEIGTEHEVSLAIINPKNERIEVGKQNKVAVTQNKLHQSKAGSAMMIWIVGMTFENYGTYQFEILLDGNTVKTLSLDIVKELPE